MGRKPVTASLIVKPMIKQIIYDNIIKKSDMEIKTLEVRWILHFENY